VGRKIFSSSYCFYWLWCSCSLVYNGCQGSSGGCTGKDDHPVLAPRLKLSVAKPLLVVCASFDMLLYDVATNSNNNNSVGVIKFHNFDLNR
jgi:hypothetical protein